MTTQQRTHYIERLLAERADVTATLARIATALVAVAEPADGHRVPGEEPETGASGVGPDDDAAIEARATAELTEIDDALRRLYESPESYGTCVICGRPISLERLEIVPTTQYCEQHASG